LNRLLDRWEFTHPDKQLDFETIQKITVDNIFGIEYNPEAIKVAAFSIYLTMLNRLNPKELWEQKKFPYLIYAPENPDKNKQGQNLFCMSSLGKGPFDSIQFDLVVGNPPFKREGLSSEAKKYLSTRGYAQEYATAFIDRATTLCPKGKIALVSTSKILFNTGKGDGDQNFRAFLFQKTYVEEIYNFSIFRTIPKKAGNSLFATAIGPACIIFYSNITPNRPSNTILYCAPKTYLRNRVADGIIIDNIDVKYLPREECKKESSTIWKTAMWGGQRDFSFIQKLKSKTTINRFLESNNFEKGVGFQTSNPQKTHNKTISTYSFLEAKNINRFYTNKSNTTAFSSTYFFRLGNPKTYIAPHILIKEGQKNKKFCASYLDYNCSFKKTIYGIHHPNSDFLKVLTSYFNSSFVVYYLFLTSSSWGIDRPRVMPYELLSLPNLLLDLTPKEQKAIVNVLDKLIVLEKSNALYNQQDIDKIETEIDKVLMNILGFSQEQKTLIGDMINLTLDAFSNKEKSIAYNPSQKSELNKYSNYAIDTLNNFLGEDDKMNIWTSVYTTTKSPLNIVSFHFNEIQKHGVITEIPSPNIRNILKELEEYSYSEFSQSIYYRKVIKYYKDDIIYIVKPNEKRFWSASVALNDADEIISELLNN